MKAARLTAVRWDCGSLKRDPLHPSSQPRRLSSCYSKTWEYTAANPRHSADLRPALAGGLIARAAQL